jgi:hypothetical protein
MKYLAIAIVFSSGLMGTATDAQAPHADREDSIQVVSQEATTLNPGAATTFTGRTQVEQLLAVRDSSRMSPAELSQPSWRKDPRGISLYAAMLIVTLAWALS